MKLTYSIESRSHPVAVERAGQDFSIELYGRKVLIQLLTWIPPRLTFLYKGQVITACVATDGKKRWVNAGGTTLVFERQDASTQRSHSHGAREGTGSGIVVAPMPGQVRAVLVMPGETVNEGQPLLLLEAMKMELQVSAPHDGKVSKIHVAPGQNVERDQILGEILESETE